MFQISYYLFQIRQCSGAVVSTKGHYMTEAEKGKGGYVLRHDILPAKVVVHTLKFLITRW